MRPNTLAKDEFSPRQIKVMQLICQEFTHKQIATKLKINARTLEDTRTSILIKTNSKNAVGIVKYAIRHGFYKLTLKKKKNK